MKYLLTIFTFAGIALILSGCGSDTPTGTVQNVNREEAASKQQGAGGSKANHGGGVADMDLVQAKPGEKTGLPEPGAKSGGN